MNTALDLAVTAALATSSPHGSEAATLDLNFTTTAGIEAAYNLLWFARASTGTYFDSNGVIQTAVNGEWRIDHDPATGACRGLLIEETRTNSIDRSEDFSLWTHANITPTMTSEIGPDGNTVYKIVEDAITGYHGLSRSVAGLAADVTGCLSIFVKKVEREFITIRLISLNSSSNYISGSFNLDTGQTLFSNIGAATGAKGGMQELSNGWFRLWLSGKPNTVNNGGCSVIVYNPAVFGGSSSYAGNGTDGFLAFGAQAEAGAGPSSYIPTLTGVATRATEYCYVPDVSWYTQAVGGTMLAEFDVIEEGSAYYRTIWEVDDGTLNNRHGFYYADAADNKMYATTRVGGVAQSDVSAGSALVLNQTYKAVYSFEANLYRTAMDGVAGSEDVAGSLPSGLTRLYIGGPVTLNGHIRRVAYWPSRLPLAHATQLSV